MTKNLLHSQRDQHEFIFIGGLHRSGTSLLHRILQQHPEISGFSNTHVPEDEGQHLQTVYPTAELYGGPGRFGFARSFYMDETHDLVSEVSCERLLSEWQPYWDINKRILIEKSPPNIFHSRFLQALFPNSKFIFIMRHPIATSFATQKWGRKSLNKLIRHWRKVHEQLEKDVPHLRHAKIIRYEDLIHHPNLTMDDIYQFIGIKSAPVTEFIKPNVNNHYFALWEKLKVRGTMAYYTIGNFPGKNYGYTLQRPYYK